MEGARKAWLVLDVALLPLMALEDDGRVAQSGKPVVRHIAKTSRAGAQAHKQRSTSIACWVIMQKLHKGQAK